jgi:4,5-DOPA dioxygenase extradiol
MDRMPALFIGHGSPMIALEHSAVTQAWRAIANGFEKPRAILVISAHWLTRMTAVTGMPNPRTIHDFGAFPQALFDVQYPAPGDPVLAGHVRDLLAPMQVMIDDEQWGLDHGTWSVLVHLYPNADIPVVQLGMDVNKTPEQHLEIGRRLQSLRDEGVLILGTGNIVHNLPAMNWSNPDTRYDWSVRFNDFIRNAIAAEAHENVAAYADFGHDAELSVPSPDHFWPLLYVLGARHDGEAARFATDFIHHGSLSMTSVAFGLG